MITDIQKRTQNMLANRKEEGPKYTTHVEPKRADHQFWRRFNKAQDNNNLTDIQKRIQNMLDNPDGQFKKAVQQRQIKITDWEKKIFDAAPEVDDTTPSDNNLTDIEKRIQNMLLNPDEQFKKAVQQGQIKESQIRKKIFDAAPEDGDTTPSDNNSDGRPDNRKEEVPKPSEPAEAAKDKGIIQLGIIAVVIAGTLGAHVWGKN
jgi:small-conductance mechanosensitive channel